MVDELDPKSVRDYFSRAGTVEQWWSPDTGPLAFHYDAELKVIDDQLPVDESSRVLDVGTGRGRFAIFMAERGCRVIAVDINSEMLDLAQEAALEREVHERIDFRALSAEDLSSMDEDGFDVLLCMELFDHLPDLGKALGQMRRLLRPGGRLVFTYVPTGSLYGLLGNVYRWLRRRWQPGKVMISRTYSRKEVEQALQQNGLEAGNYFGLGVLCVNAQTRLFQDENVFSRMTLSLARAEARRWPYYASPLLSRVGAHVVGISRVPG
ncbi:MAG: methyltransferase domain-containing protein [Myxococcota bacterium]|nr:methyltransferase domain-containing protein [Myxococcota bacterium]